MKKKKYKKKKSLLKIMKEYAAVITIGMTILAFLLNAMINYYRKCSSTEFYFHYLTLNIEDENWVKNYQKKENILPYHQELKAPTLNNKINKLLYQYPHQTKGYFVNYLIIKQIGKSTATDIKINFKQFGNSKSLENKNLTDYPINKKKHKLISKKIEYPFPKEETLKIPLSICKSQNKYTTTPTDCYYIMLQPVSIEYRNKYLFFKRTIPIREYIEHDVIIDGEVITGKGSSYVEEDKKEWYLK